MYKRQPFLYFSDLAIIIGNDMVDGTEAATATKTEDGHLFDEVVDLDDDRDFNTPMHDTLVVDEEFVHENISSTFARQSHSTPMLRRPKKRNASMASSLDVICESIQDICTGMKEAHTIKVDKGETKQDIMATFAALKAIPRVSQETLVVAYDTFTSEPTKAWGFL